jgi:hypothetical protein
MPLSAEGQEVDKHRGQAPAPEAALKFTLQRAALNKSTSSPAIA